ncbi:unnamed protein product [Prunus armeniaca]
MPILVSPVQVVLKKGGVTIVKNDNNELIPIRTVTGWHVCIDYRKLNTATHDYSGYNQISIEPEDQEKTTFTCPFGTFSYRRMSLGLCNATTTFRCCMMSIFSDMVERFIEVFMDDFSIVGSSFDSCLSNLALVLQHCEETNLVLNWEKSHFMVREGIVPGHKISTKGIEVDKAKIREGRPKLPWSQRDVTFNFDDQCLEAFKILKEKLTSALVNITPNWEVPFEIMCDASDYAVGAVLGQRKDKLLHVISYASQTLKDAQLNCATIEKELLAIVYALDKFRSYLIGFKVIVYTDNSALKCLLSKKDANHG